MHLGSHFSHQLLHFLLTIKRVKENHLIISSGLVLPAEDRSYICWNFLVIGIRLGVEKNQLCVCAAQEEPFLFDIIEFVWWRNLKTKCQESQNAGKSCKQLLLFQPSNRGMNP